MTPHLIRCRGETMVAISPAEVAIAAFLSHKIDNPEVDRTGPRRGSRGGDCE
jgi:hypothetical protein